MTARRDVVAALAAAGCVRAVAEARLLLAQASDSAELACLVSRRVAGEPLEHVLGWAAFDGRRYQVAPGVFVPRVRSVALVGVAARYARPGAVVLDLCCGCGALGRALADRVPGIGLHAADLDPAAVRCARANVADIGGRVHRGDLWDALPSRLRGRIDLVLANAPYVPTDAVELMPRDWREHEARAALDGGPDGLDPHRRIAAGAPAWLAPGGVLLFEVSLAQADEAAGILARAGLRARSHPRRGSGVAIVAGRATSSSASAAWSGR